MDFVDTPNISVVREDTGNGIKVEMELGSGKMEDHLFLFNVSSKIIIFSVLKIQGVPDGLGDILKRQFFQIWIWLKNRKMIHRNS